MLSMVAGTVGFAPQPRGRADLPARTSARACRDDPPEHRQLRLGADEGDAVRDSGGAAVLVADALTDGLGGQAADEALFQRRRGRGYERGCASSVIALSSPAHPGVSVTASDLCSPGSWGLLFCAACAAIVIFLVVQGIRFLRPDMLWTNPKVGFSQSETGGFFSPLVGTVLVTTIALLIATPIGVGVAVWLSEYGRPTVLARLVESTTEMFAGAPSIVLALFGVIIFRAPVLAFLSASTQGHALRQVVLHRRRDPFGSWRCRSSSPMCARVCARFRTTCERRLTLWARPGSRRFGGYCCPRRDLR